ncbi:hypothetical protein BH11ACT3_BH11ACT3_15720 [soil metagenome]
MDDARLHVSVDRGAKRAVVPGVHLHWRKITSPAGGAGIESCVEALEQLYRCGPAIATVVAADSALNLGLISMAEVRQALGDSRRARRVIARVDGSSESGTETIARVALRGLRVAVRTQVAIAGVGRVDLVVGDRLVIELDSRAWHDKEDSYEEDRRRDAALVARGYLVMRFTYRRVIGDWPRVESEIRDVIRRGDHRWSARQRR